MSGGALHVLAIFDKPDPLVGPYFEETIYVTPSRHDHGGARRRRRVDAPRDLALGLAHGPIHARAEAHAGWAARARNCAAVDRRAMLARAPLRFGDVSLEEVILGHAYGLGAEPTATRAPRRGGDDDPGSAAGTLRSIDGRESARSIPGDVEDVRITVPIGDDAGAVARGLALPGVHLRARRHARSGRGEPARGASAVAVRGRAESRRRVGLKQRRDPDRDFHEEGWRAW